MFQGISDQLAPFPIPFPQWGKGSSFYNKVWPHQTIMIPQVA